MPQSFTARTRSGKTIRVVKANKRKPRQRRVRGGSKLTQQIQRVLNKNLETKYVVHTDQDQPLYNTINTAINPTGGYSYLLPCIPQIVRGGINSDNMTGAKIKVVSLKTYIHFNFASQNNTTNDVMVKIFFLHSKNTQNYTVAANGLLGSNLLRTGQASEVDWIGSGTGTLEPRCLAQLPLNKLAWTGTTRTFRLSKNGGILNGGTSSALPVLANGNGSFDISYDWKCSKTLKYDESDNSIYPENYLPLMAAVAWYPDGTSSGAKDTVMPVYATATHHLYYKDA